MLAATANRGQKPLFLGGDQKDVGARGWLFERLQQRVLPVRIEQFRFVNDEHFVMSHVGTAPHWRIETLAVAHRAADHELAQEIKWNVGLLAIAQFFDRRGFRAFLAHDVEIRMRLRIDQFRDARVAWRLELIEMRRVHFAVEEQSRALQRSGAFSHAARSKENPRVMHVTRANRVRELRGRRVLPEEHRTIVMNGTRLRDWCLITDARADNATGRFVCCSSCRALRHAQSMVRELRALNLRS